MGRPSDVRTETGGVTKEMALGGHGAVVGTSEHARSLCKPWSVASKVLSLHYFPAVLF